MLDSRGRISRKKSWLGLALVLVCGALLWRRTTAEWERNWLRRQGIGP